MSFRWLTQENIRVDWDMNPRERDEDYIRTIARHMNENGYDAKFPIVVYQFKDEIEAEAKALGIPVNLYCTEVYHAATGHHRFGASLLQDDEFPNLPLPEVYCEIREGTRSEYVRWMLVDNFQHTPGFNRNIGKTPTRKELQQMRFQLLFFPDVFGKGDRLLADKWGCDHKTVGEVRNWFISKLSRGETPQPAHVSDSDIEEIKEIIESDLYLGKDGKKYPRTAQAKPEPEVISLLEEKSKKIWDLRISAQSRYEAQAEINEKFSFEDMAKYYIDNSPAIGETFRQAWLLTNYSSYELCLSVFRNEKITLDELNAQVEAMKHFDMLFMSHIWKTQSWVKKLLHNARISDDTDSTSIPKRFYTQIIHANEDDAPYSHTNELHFPSKEDREQFGKEFVAYHDSHNHDGKAPEIRIVKSADLSAGAREQAKKMIRNDEEGWGTDYDGWFRQELKSKISYFKPTCIIPVGELEKALLDADLKKKLTDIFTLHGSIPVYNPSTQKSYSEELAQDSSLSAANVYFQINQFKEHIHELEKGIKKSLKQDPRWKPDSLACAMMEDVEVVKTIMSNIESRQQFDKQQQGKEETPALSIVPEPEPAETETPVQFEIKEMEITLKVQKLNGKIYDYIFVNDNDKGIKISDLPGPLLEELIKFVKSYLEEK